MEIEFFTVIGTIKYVFKKNNLNWALYSYLQLLVLNTIFNNYFATLSLFLFFFYSKYVWILVLPETIVIWFFIILIVLMTIAFIYVLY